MQEQQSITSAIPPDCLPIRNSIAQDVETGRLEPGADLKLLVAVQLVEQVVDLSQVLRGVECRKVMRLHELEVGICFDIADGVSELLGDLVQLSQFFAEGTLTWCLSESVAT
jgi:hypothetical protein